MRAKLFELYFESGVSTIELTKTRFCHPLLPEEQIAVRGKVAGAILRSGAFQWTKGVQALAQLMLAALSKRSKREADLNGVRGSFAAALDEAVHKSSLWLLDLFGMDEHGVPLAKRVLLRSNPGLRRPGPVSLSLNRSFIPLSGIRVYLNGMRLDAREDLLHLAHRISGVESPESYEEFSGGKRTRRASVR
jgi:hypothetical protein